MASAFTRLQDLGEERFKYILNLLMQGETAMGVARLLQGPPPKGWGLFQETPEKTLTQQVNRLRFAATEGVYGEEVAHQIAAGAKPQIKLLAGVSIPAIERLEELSDIQRDRVLAHVEKEKIHPGHWNAANEVIKEYRQLLLDIQKIRFDLGLDAWKGPIMAMRGTVQNVSMPDGTNVQKQVFEAVSAVEEIFNARKIPHLIARE